MEVNCFQHYWFVKGFLPSFQARKKGQIAFTISAAATIGAVRLSTYCASKSAAFGFAESLHFELQHLGYKDIYVTIMNPSFIKGPSTSLFTGAGANPYLVPILKDTFVADRMVDAIKRKEVLVQTPFMVWIGPLARLLPPFAVTFLYSFFGINRAMKGFVSKDSPRNASKAKQT